MQFKIDTRERFHVITIRESALTANMTAIIEDKLSRLLTEKVKSVILNLTNTRSVDPAVANTLLQLQKQFYDANASFVLCCLQPEMRQQLSIAGLLEQMNTTFTESEAGEIVLMEEIERELDL